MQTKDRNTQDAKTRLYLGAELTVILNVSNGTETDTRYPALIETYERMCADDFNNGCPPIWNDGDFIYPTIHFPYEVKEGKKGATKLKTYNKSRIV